MADTIELYGKYPHSCPLLLSLHYVRPMIPEKKLRCMRIVWKTRVWSKDREGV